jgi:hypothetical protein
MKNSNVTFIVFILLSLFSCSCEDEKNETRPLVGKVLLINSTTPVDKALVRFMRSNSNMMFGPSSSQVTQEVITGPDGTFIIPDTTTADYIQAWGIDSIFGGTPSLDLLIANYIAEGGSPKLYLRPPATVLVRAVDVEPYNPEYTHVFFSTEPESLGGWEECTANDVSYDTNGNVSLMLMFKKYNSITDAHEFVYIDTEPFAPFVTSEYVFEY